MISCKKQPGAFCDLHMLVGLIDPLLRYGGVILTHNEVGEVRPEAMYLSEHTNSS